MKLGLRAAGAAALALAIMSGLAETLSYSGGAILGGLEESAFLPFAFVLAAIGLGLIAASMFVGVRK